MADIPGIEDLQKQGWLHAKHSITKEYTFESFDAAIEFVNNIAQIVKQETHHPDIILHSEKKVAVNLRTHDVNEVTAKDVAFAKRVDAL